MASIHISIGHDDDLVVAKFIQVQSFVILDGAEADSKGCDNIFYLLVVVDLMLLRLLNIQDLAS
jgi:hypothetical protein